MVGKLKLFELEGNGGQIVGEISLSVFRDFEFVEYRAGVLVAKVLNHHAHLWV